MVGVEGDGEEKGRRRGGEGEVETGFGGTMEGWKKGDV